MEEFTNNYRGGKLDVDEYSEFLLSPLIGKSLKDLKIPLAGKTGTTNDNKDAWFIGYSPDLVVGVYVGYDKPKNLGYKQTGSSVAVPIFRDFIIRNG